MKSFIRLTAAVIVLLAAIFTGVNILLTNILNDSENRPYRVEAERIAVRIERGEQYDLSGYEYVTSVEPMDSGFIEGGSDYLVKDINGRLYRFDYIYKQDSRAVITALNICLAVVSAAVLALLVYVYFKIIRPFRRISGYPAELAKGTLTVPLKDSKNGYFGRFLWGLDLLREKLESQRAAELELQKKNRTMVMSLSHDIKTPLGLIELNAKALEKGLYKDEQKKLDTARSISEKCEVIRGYVDDILKTSSEDIVSAEVTSGEFYLSELIQNIKAYYTEKLALLRTDFHIENFTDILISGDCERAEEVLQNIIENAVKYGDGKEISISFSREEDCQLIHIRNSGCTLSPDELPHIFDSFWRGSNVGSHSGSGLGLYICRTLMRRMNGDVYAQTDGRDMTVSVVIPMA